jgi:hypothetical protein
MPEISSWSVTNARGVGKGRWGGTRKDGGVPGVEEKSKNSGLPSVEEQMSGVARKEGSPH